MSSHFIDTNGIRLHYLHFQGKGPTILLMHGLTANAHAFDGLMKAGLSPAFNVLSVDLRGRGQSDQPAEGYSLEDHGKDILGLLDALGLSDVIMGGHSYGALLTLYLAAHHPERISKMILLDAAARMHPNTKEMLGPALSRLGQRFDSFDAYLKKVKAAPYLDFWDEQMESYYRADVEFFEDGSVMPIPKPDHMVQAVNGVLAYPIVDDLKDIKKSALLVNGPGVYTMDAALLPEENARETVAMMQHCLYVKVPGNHQTMLYGKGAIAIKEAIFSFLSEETAAVQFDQIKQ